MSRRNIFIFFITIFVLALNVKLKYRVELKSNGYQPSEITIKKGDSVKFFSEYSSFWPASNPHPNHTQSPDFDPKRATAKDKSWDFTFDKAGVYTYHDHLNPFYKGKIKVVETNLFVYLKNKFANFTRVSFEKHDSQYINKVSVLCKGEEWEERKNLIDCWNSYFSELVKDFGPNESLRILDALTTGGFVSLSDCHNFADQIGSDSYWQKVSGKSFTFDDTFGICSYGFFHGFMLEDVSHGQDFEASFKLCNKLANYGENMVNECFVGVGNGLAYYFWNTLGEDVVSIVGKSKSVCESVGKYKDSCVYGVYGGMEHLYLKIHGSSLSIDQTNPYFVCSKELGDKYLPYCYEKIDRPLFSDLNFDIVKIASWINKIPNQEIRKAEAKSIGNFVSQFWIYKDEADFVLAKSKCYEFRGILYSSCLEGVFEGILSNLNESGRADEFKCLGKSLTSSEINICLLKKKETIEAVKTF